MNIKDLLDRRVALAMDLLDRCIALAMALQEEYLKPVQDFKKQEELQNEFSELKAQILQLMDDVVY